MVPLLCHFTTPVEGNGDYDWANDKERSCPNGGPDRLLNDEFLEDIPKALTKS